jgi:hypothetical protein
MTSGIITERRSKKSGVCGHIGVQKEENRNALLSAAKPEQAVGGDMDLKMEPRGRIRTAPSGDLRLE